MWAGTAVKLCCFALVRLADLTADNLLLLVTFTGNAVTNLAVAGLTFAGKSPAAFRDNCFEIQSGWIRTPVKAN